MATEAQIQANRLNAQKSTGPRTPEGKEKVSQNAVRHGLLAQTAVLHEEDRDQYARYRAEMLAELGPQGLQEKELAERIVGLSWRLGRAGRYQDAVLEALCDEYVAKMEETLVASDAEPLAGGDAILGRMLLADFSGPRILERLQLYERRIENSLSRARAEWRQLRRKSFGAALGGIGLFAVKSDNRRGNHPASPAAGGNSAAATSPPARPIASDPARDACLNKQTQSGRPDNGPRFSDRNKPQGLRVAASGPPALGMAECESRKDFPLLGQAIPQAFGFGTAVPLPQDLIAHVAGRRDILNKQTQSASRSKHARVG